MLLFYWLQATVQRWDCDPFFGVFHDMLLFVKSIESICDKRMMLIYDMGFFVCCLFLSLSVFCPLVCLCAREYLCLVRIIDPNSNKLRLICHHSSEIVSIIVRRTLSITLAADQTIEAITIQVIKSMPCQFHLPFFPHTPTGFVTYFRFVWNCFNQYYNKFDDCSTKVHQFSSIFSFLQKYNMRYTFSRWNVQTLYQFP